MNERMSPEEYLRENGIYVTSTSGVSMSPMLRNRRDAVRIILKNGRLKKYDVAMFRRGKETVLHRVIKVLPDGYIIRGDNCIGSDTVKEENVVGVLVSFTRNNKQYETDDLSYRIYSRLIVAANPFLRFYIRLRSLIGKAIKKQTTQ